LVKFVKIRDFPEFLKFLKVRIVDVSPVLGQCMLCSFARVNCTLCSASWVCRVMRVKQ